MESVSDFFALFVAVLLIFPLLVLIDKLTSAIKQSRFDRLDQQRQKCEELILLILQSPRRGEEEGILTQRFCNLLDQRSCTYKEWDELIPKIVSLGVTEETSDGGLIYYKPKPHLKSTLEARRNAAFSKLVLSE